jgi:DNA topoisomerase IA
MNMTDVITINGIKYKQVTTDDQSYFELKELQNTISKYKFYVDQELQHAKQLYEDMKELGLSINMVEAEATVCELNYIKEMVYEFFPDSTQEC